MNVSVNKVQTITGISERYICKKKSEERYIQAFEYSTLKEVHSFDQASVEYSS